MRRKTYEKNWQKLYTVTLGVFFNYLKSKLEGMYDLNTIHNDHAMFNILR